MKSNMNAFQYILIFLAPFVLTAPSRKNVRIHDIQGTSFISPMNGQTVYNVEGIVTGIDVKYGFYLQDPQPDDNPATSEGIFVFFPTAATDTQLKLAAGDFISIGEAQVDEFRPRTQSMWVNGTYYNSVTQLTRIKQIKKLGTNRLDDIKPRVLGGPEMPSNVIFNNDPFDLTAQSVHVEASNLKLNLSRGLDFWESLEGMLVHIPDPLTVSPDVSRASGFWVVANEGKHATGMNSEGGITINRRPDGVVDANPERILVGRPLDKTKSTTKSLTVGSSVSDITGVVNFSFGNWKVYPIYPYSVTRVNQAHRIKSTSISASSCDLTIANYNVENLQASSSDKKYEKLAKHIVDFMKSPDIVGLQEIQGNRVPATSTGPVSSSDTMKKFIRFIQKAGGPVYEFIEVASINNMDGGAPGGNIRPVFMYRPDRVTLQDAAEGAGQSVDEQQVFYNRTAMQVSLKYNPGRIDPSNKAWDRSRKSIAASFRFREETIIIVNNHWKSKLGSSSMFGSLQPSSNGGVATRIAQAAVVKSFVQDIIKADPNANIVVQGDFNEFQVTRPMEMLMEAGLTDLMEHLLPPEDRYSYIFDGNSQALDHILVSNNLLTNSHIQVLHLNTLYPDAEGASDHDPVLSSINLCKKKRKNPVKL